MLFAALLTSPPFLLSLTHIVWGYGHLLVYARSLIHVKAPFALAAVAGAVDFLSLLVAMAVLDFPSIRLRDLSWPKTPSVPLVDRKEHQIEYHRSYWM